MILEIQSIEKDDTWLLVTDTQGNKNEITYSSLAQYWNYSNEFDIERFSANVVQNTVLVVATTASGQSGLVGVWDNSVHKWTHISNGDYAVQAIICGKYVVTLFCVSNFVTRAHNLISIAKLNLLDLGEESLIKTIDVKDYSDDSKITAEIVDNKIFVTIYSDIYSIDLLDN